MRTRQLIPAAIAGFLLTAAVTANAQSGHVVPAYMFVSINCQGAIFTDAGGINDAHSIVGTFIDAGSVMHGYLKPAGQPCKPFDVPGASSTAATGINNQGRIVGFFVDADGPGGFVKIGMTFKTFRLRHSTQTNPMDINNNNQVAGDVLDVAGTRHGFGTKSGRAGKIHVEGATYTAAVGINDDFEIVGHFGDEDGDQHGFVRRADGSYETVDFPGGVLTHLAAINDADLMAGHFSFMAKDVEAVPGPSHGFVYDGVTFTPFDFPQAAETVAHGLNDLGEVVGFYFDGQQVGHGFLAIPQ